MEWVRSLVRHALAARLYPVGSPNWEIVDAAIMTIEPIVTYLTINPDTGAPLTVTYAAEPSEATAVRLLVDSDHNAVTAERALEAAGTRVIRDPSYNPYAPGNHGIRLIVQPAPDSHGRWERDL
ncbi:hypothetical protein [Tenggerimyces flavus]|uniref:Glyoxalase-like domain-containing protein n=1 Tax=Tenggerimyces flavus TaxID=1708749 RepID=A0ABV7Y4V1_9ACTN|nr:hypothetical protein [Tenggerimyces flavus]MBM7790090.1 hypothetical protein [Tenggerimyces flavus]